MINEIQNNVILEQENNYERFNLKNNLDILLYLITSFTPVDIITINYYDEEFGDFKLSGYFIIIEDEFDRFILYNIDKEINNSEDIIKNVYEYIEKNPNKLDNIDIILNDEKFNEVRDKIYFTYFNDITFSKFYEIIETENTNLIENIKEINKRLSVINESEYELPEEDLSIYEIEGKNYVKRGPSPNIKNQVVPVIKEVYDNRLKKKIRRTYYVRADKLEKEIKSGKLSAKDLGTINEKKLLNKILHVDLTQFFGNKIRDYINNPEEFGVEAFSLLGKSQYYKGKLLEMMNKLGLNLDIGFDVKFLSAKRVKDGKGVELSTEVSLKINDYDIIKSSNKITIEDLEDNGFGITLSSKSRLIKNNENLNEFLKLIGKEREGGLTDNERNRIKQILSNKNGENIEIKFVINKFNQILTDKDGNKIERPIKQATLINHNTNVPYEFYSMLEIANLVDLLRNKVDKIDIDIKADNDTLNGNNYKELYTKAILIGFGIYNDNKRNFSLFKQHVLNNIQNINDKDIKNAFPKIKNLLDEIDNKKYLKNPLKEFLIKFYREIKLPKSYKSFADAIKQVYLQNFNDNINNYKLSFTTKGMTKNGKRSRSELILDTFLILTDVNNYRYDGIIRKEHSFRNINVSVKDTKTGRLINKLF